MNKQHNYKRAEFRLRSDQQYNVSFFDKDNNLVGLSGAPAFEQRPVRVGFQGDIYPVVVVTQN